MNAATMQSKRLQRVLHYLKRVQKASTLQIIQQARVASVSPTVSELRQHGHKIKCERQGGVFFYSLEA